MVTPRCGRRSRPRIGWPTAPLVLLMIALAPPPTATAQDPAAAAGVTWWGSLTADPVRFASLPMSFEEAISPPPGKWQASFAVEYFNLWFGSWHTGVIHREFGLQGTPLNPWELRTLERRHPDDPFFRLDVEGWRGRLTVARGLGHGLGVVVDVPWIQIGAPRWDAISSKFHELFGLPVGDRNDIARGQTLIYIRGRDRDRHIEAWNELNGSGLGDLRLTVNGPLGGWLGGRHAWAVSVEAPTGARGTLRGSGGWDLGARWFGTWSWRSSRLRLGAGYTKLARSGTFLGVQRADTWHALGEWLLPVGRADSLMVGFTLHTSPLHDFTDAHPAAPSLVLDLGWGFPVGNGRRIELSIAENVTGDGTAPDLVLRIRVVGAPRR